jgi:glutamate:Na+ symporter, ESS family
MPFLLALGGLSLLLAAGLGLRLVLPVLGRLLLPVSLIGGFLGLAAGPYGAGIVPPDTMALWASLPAILINFVFACLFLGAVVPSSGAIVRVGGPLVRFSLIGALGQYVVGLALTWLVLTPVFGTSALFACLIEVGFSGGHGTASAMAAVFADLGFPAGAALGQMSATVGLVVGVLGGVALIQYGVRHGHTTQVGADGLGGLPRDSSGFLAPEARRPIALGTISSDVLEPFTLHVAVASLAVLIGWGLLLGIRALHPSLRGFPLFPLAMVGGMLIQVVAGRTGAAAWFDRGTFQRLMGLALDLLVVAAVASMPLDLVMQNVVPFALLMVVAIIWVVATFLWLGPRLLPVDWFEQAIVVYGTQTGVAAVGLMLLRIVDPHQRTTAAQAFAARSMVISPLLGGGVVTATMPLLIQQFGVPQMLAATTAATLLCYMWPRGGAAPATP